MLVDEEIAAEFLPRLKTRLVENRAEKGLKPVELRLDEKAQSVIAGTPAGPDDFDTEFLDYILAVKVVSGYKEAIQHINTHSTELVAGHAESIGSTDEAAVAAFRKTVDSSSVYVNASTRFTDGGEFGFGAEMGIST